MIALDTHALIWWLADPTRIPDRARRRIQAALEDDETLVVSSISIWEIAMLVKRGRLQLTIPTEAWIAAVQSLPIFRFQPVDNAVALRAVELPDFDVRDPADRFIVATALGAGATLVTGDRRLRSYRPLSAVWD